MKVFYLPLEPYPERYTELLTNWTVSRLRARGIEHEVVEGTRLGAGIGVGQVLDAHGRCYWSLSQLAALVARLRECGTTPADVVYFDDMFTPGYEALPYIFAQLPESSRPRVYARNHAQSVDPDDFTFPMRAWMRRYEQLVYTTATGVICGSTVHREMMQAAGLDRCPIHVLGLPYDAHDVASRAARVAWEDRPYRVIYSSRLDAEKQPHFFFDIVERMAGSGVEFVISTGAKAPRSNDPSVLARLVRLQASGLIRVHAQATKATYYQLLASSRVQLNTARQDFISYTAIEASTLGVPTLAPGFRSFPECLGNMDEFLYTPWVQEDAVRKLKQLLYSEQGPDTERVSRLSHDQHETLDRIITLFEQETP